MKGKNWKDSLKRLAARATTKSLTDLSAETISRVLGAKKEETPAESDHSAKPEVESEMPAPKKSNRRKKKKDTSAESSHPTAV